MTTTSPGNVGEGFVRISVYDIEDLVWLIGLLEDWLLHASDDAYDDLAAFAGGGPFTRPADRHARTIAHELGGHHLALRRALQAAGIDPDRSC